MTVQDRLLKYIAYWTTSDEESDCVPSSDREFSLGKALEAELKELGLEKVLLTDKCYVYGLLPRTADWTGNKTIALIAHLDTAPDFNGRDVKPQIIPNYDGKDVLLKGSGQLLKVSDFPDLSSLKGRTLITTDGTSLLGADDKAGIAVILTMVENLKNSNTPHGDIWVCFTPDEEIGGGAENLDLSYINADFAFTVDGGYEGEVAYENFNACSAEFSVKGVNVHPGEAKDIMVNAALIAAEIVSLVPSEETPAKTEGRQGFYHLTDLCGDVASAKVSYIIRDHDKGLFKKRKETMQSIETQMKNKYGDDFVSLTISDSYENMLSVIEKHYEIIDLAKNAIKSAGLEPVSEPVRGGTDGAQLSFRGLPCPNLGAGGYGFHGPYEHISVEGMETAVKICTEICKNLD